MQADDQLALEFQELVSLVIEHRERRGCGGISECGCRYQAVFVQRF
jgi:hypothetical protein